MTHEKDSDAQVILEDYTFEQAPPYALSLLQ